MRKGLVVVVASAAVVSLPGIAWAHGQLRPGRAAAGATVSTVLVVPSERDGRDNARVALAMPPGFTATACDAPVGWTCATSERGITWSRVTGVVAAEDFDLTMRVSDTAGTYVFPLSQTYDDGEERTFAGAPGSRDEAPLFTVTGGGRATAASPPASPSSRPTTSAPSTSRTAAASASATASVAAPSAGPSSASVAPTTLPSARPSSPAAGLAGLPPGRRLETESSDSGPAVVIALVFVALTALGVAVLAVRRKGDG